MSIKCLMNGLEVNYPCSTVCPLFGDCVSAFEAQRKAKSVTNADWIRAMSDKELVEFIGHNSLCDRIQDEGTWCEEHAVCEICLAKWLQQPAELSDSPDEDDRDSGLVEEE